MKTKPNFSSAPPGGEADNIAAFLLVLAYTGSRVSEALLLIGPNVDIFSK